MLPVTQFISGLNPNRVYKCLPVRLVLTLRGMYQTVLFGVLSGSAARDHELSAEKLRAAIAVLAKLDPSSNADVDRIVADIAAMRKQKNLGAGGSFAAKAAIPSHLLSCKTCRDFVCILFQNLKTKIVSPSIFLSRPGAAITMGEFQTIVLASASSRAKLLQALSF